MKKLGVVLLVLLQCSVYAGEGTLSVGMQYGLMLEKVTTGATTNSTIVPTPFSYHRQYVS
jgi:hypothetical protein